MTVLGLGRHDGDVPHFGLAFNAVACPISPCGALSFSWLRTRSSAASLTCILYRVAQTLPVGDVENVTFWGVGLRVRGPKPAHRNSVIVKTWQAIRQSGQSQPFFSCASFTVRPTTMTAYNVGASQTCQLKRYCISSQTMPKTSSHSTPKRTDARSDITSEYAALSVVKFDQACGHPVLACPNRLNLHTK